MHFVLIYKHLGWFLIQRHLGLKICIGLGTTFFSWCLIQRNTLYMKITQFAYKISEFFCISVLEGDLGCISGSILGVQRGFVFCVEDI